MSRPSEVAEALEVAINNMQSVMVWGPPGGGKSAVTRQVGDKLNRRIIDVRLSQLESVDLRGLPSVKGDRTHWMAPSFLPKEGDGPTILALEEINSGLPSTQAAAYQLVLDRRLGDYVVPDNCAIIATGNRDTDRGVTYAMPAPLANRFVHLEFEVHFDDWKKWAIERDLNGDVVSFLSFRPGLLMDPDFDKRAFPTPRSWEFVSKIIGKEEGTINPIVERALVSGAVGEGAAAEFAAFLKIRRNLENPDWVMMNPDKAQVPKDPATLYALCGALSERANPQNFERFTKFVDRVKPEFQVLMMRDAIMRTKELTIDPAFQKWAAANANVII